MFQNNAEIIVNETVKENIWGLHSMFLWLLIETGIIGIVIYIIFIIIILRLKNISQKYKKLFLIILFSQITEFFLDHVEYFQLFYYFIIVLIAYQYYYEKRKNDEKNFIY